MPHKTKTGDQQQGRRIEERKRVAEGGRERRIADRMTDRETDRQTDGGNKITSSVI